MSATKSARFERTFVVSEGDIDRLGHVNNIVYLQWVQDVAASHWLEASTPELRDEIVWVAVRHEIDYKAPAFDSEEVVATTWVDEWTGVTSVRHTEIVRPADGKLLAKAQTTWCAVDPASQRPRRVSDDIKQRFLVQAPE